LLSAFLASIAVRARICDQVSKLNVGSPVTEGNREALGNRVQLRAVVFVCLTQQAQIPAHVVSCWCAPTFWVPAINKGKIKKFVAAQSGRALHSLQAMRWQQIFSIHTRLRYNLVQSSSLSLFLNLLRRVHNNDTCFCVSWHVLATTCSGFCSSVLLPVFWMNASHRKI